MAQLKAANKLRQMLAEPDKITVCPGVHDGLTARMALHVGFDALYMVSNRNPFAKSTRLFSLSPLRS